MSFTGAPGAPLDVLSTPYGLSGQFSPETAVAEQALNRKRLIANLMMQQGLQGAPAGQMVGRFYVPSSPLQGASHLLQAGLGAYLGNRINTEQNDLASKDRQSVIDAITAYKTAMKPREVTDQSPPVAPPAPMPGPEMAGTPPAPMPTEPFRGIAPRPDGPYSGEVGAVAMPEPGVQSEKEPIINGPYAGQYKFGVNPSGLSQDITPGDMSQFSSPGGPAPQAPPMTPAAPPMPPPQPTPRMMGPTDEERRNAIIDLLTHPHPQVQRFGQLEMQRMMQEAEHARDQGNKDRGFGLQEKGQNLTAENTRALREDTKAYREASLAQQKELTGATQAIAQQRANTDRMQADAAAQQAKDRLAAELKIAKGHDATTLAAAQLKADKRGELPVSALEKQGDSLDAISTASSIKSDLSSIRNQITSGKLKLGMFENLASEAKNRIGNSDENSRNYASLLATLEKNRNDSLRLNKGVQTEGDSVRAWNELVANINDPKVVEQRLSEIEAINERAVKLHRAKIDAIRNNFNAGPIDTGAFENQPAAVGANKGAARSIKRTGMHNGKKVIEYSDGSIEYAP